MNKNELRKIIKENTPSGIVSELEKHDLTKRDFALFLDAGHEYLLNKNTNKSDPLAYVLDFHENALKTVAEDTGRVKDVLEALEDYWERNGIEEKKRRSKLQDQYFNGGREDTREWSRRLAIRLGEEWASSELRSIISGGWVAYWLEMAHGLLDGGADPREPDAKGCRPIRTLMLYGEDMCSRRPEHKDRVEGLFMRLGALGNGFDDLALVTPTIEKEIEGKWLEKVALTLKEKKEFSETTTEGKKKDKPRI